jgi:hypothetical protein
MGKREFWLYVIAIVGVLAFVAIVVVGNDRSTTDNEVRLECVKHWPPHTCEGIV